MKCISCDWEGPEHNFRLARCPQCFKLEVSRVCATCGHSLTFTSAGYYCPICSVSTGTIHELSQTEIPVSDPLKNIKPGDLFDNPEGCFTHCTSCMVLVCNQDVRREKEKYWQCLHLWNNYWGFKGGYDFKPEGIYNYHLPEELSKMEYKGNIYDLIKDNWGGCIFLEPQDRPGFRESEK